MKGSVPPSGPVSPASRKAMKGGRSALVAVCLAMLGGCAGHRVQLRQALLSDQHPAAHARELPALYVVRCPDVLEVKVEGRHPPELRSLTLPARLAVGADGQITLSPR